MGEVREQRSVYCTGGQAFGLQDRQYRRRTDQIVTGAYWFNGTGNFLGHGDLSIEDFCSIAAKIDPGDRFIIVGSRFLCRDAPDRSDLEFLSTHALWVITSTTAYCSHDTRLRGLFKEDTPPVVYHLSPTEMAAFIRGG